MNKMKSALRANTPSDLLRLQLDVDVAQGGVDDGKFGQALVRKRTVNGIRDGPCMDDTCLIL